MSTTEARDAPYQKDYAVFEVGNRLVGMFVDSLEYAQECARVNKSKLYSYNGERVITMATKENENLLEVTGVRLYPVKNSKSALLANCSVEFNGALACTGFHIIDGKDGIFVSFPSEKWKDGTYHDITFPTTKEDREYIVDAVLKVWEEESKKDEGKEEKKSSRRR